MNIIDEFKKVRDIPYRIPLALSEPDYCCTGKAELLIKKFTQGGYSARYRVGICTWGSLNLPSEIAAINHDDHTSHTYCEIQINGEWKVVDATWDKQLRGTFRINDWDGKSDLELAFPKMKILSPEESQKYFHHIMTNEAIIADLEKNSIFYEAVNTWLDKKRRKRSGL